MTVNINEIVSIVQQFKSHMDNSNDAVWSLNVNDLEASIHVKEKVFLNKFIDFEIEINAADSYPYKLVSCIEGISFFALLDIVELDELKTAMSDKWEYIQNKLRKNER